MHPADECIAEFLLLTMQPLKRPGVQPFSVMAEMGGEDEQTFHKRDDERTDHHHRDNAENLSGHTRYEINRQKRRYIGQNTERHRKGNLPRPPGRRLHKRKALLMIAVNVFSHHNGIVHHNSQGNDEGEHRKHIEADPHDGEDEKRSQEGDGDPHHYPECEAGLQKQSQKNHHENQPHGPVFQHQIRALPVMIGPVPIHMGLDSPGQFRLQVIYFSLHGAVDRNRGLIAHPVHLQFDGGLAVKTHVSVGFLKSIRNPADVRHAHLGSGGGIDNGKSSEFTPVVTALGHPQQDLTANRINVTSGQINRPLPDSPGNIAEGQPVTAEHLLGHFHTDLKFRKSPDIDLRDILVLQQFVPHALRQAMEGLSVNVTVQNQIQNTTPERVRFHFRLFRLIRERGYVVNLALHIIRQLLDIGSAYRLHPHMPPVFTRG